MAIKFRSFKSQAYARCTTRMYAVNRHQIPHPDGLRCTSCLKPLKRASCCCNCFEANFPGMDCEGLIDAWGGWRVIVESGSQCIYNEEDPLACIWRSYCGDKLCSELTINIDPKTGAMTATLILNFYSDFSLSDDAAFSIRYQCDDFDCSGGDFALDEVFYNTTECSASIAPAEVTVRARSSCSGTVGICPDVDVVRFIPVAGYAPVGDNRFVYDGNGKGHGGFEVDPDNGFEILECLETSLSIPHASFAELHRLAPDSAAWGVLLDCTTSGVYSTLSVDFQCVSGGTGCTKIYVKITLCQLNGVGIGGGDGWRCVSYEDTHHKPIQGFVNGDEISLGSTSFGGAGSGIKFRLEWDEDE